MAQENNAADGMSMEALLNATLGDLPELNAVPPAGTYAGKLKLAVKTVKNVVSVECEYSIVEVVEQDDSEAKPAKAGSKFSTLLMTNQDIAMGQLRKILESVAAKTGDDSLKGALGQSFDVMFVLKHRLDKNDKDIKYPNVTKLDLI